MTGSSSKFQRKKIVIGIFVFALLSLTVFVFHNSKPVLFFQGFIQSAFSVPKNVLYSLGKNERDSKIYSLTQKNLKLEQKMADYALLKSENEALKSQFSISTDTSQNLISAKIIGFQGSSKNPTNLIINAGLKDKVKIGMAVIFERYLIGKIDTVSQDYSVVMTTLNPQFRVLAKLPETNANGIILGRNDFMFLDGVVITDTLKKDGIIVTKGEVDDKGIGVLPDLIIGKISSIFKNETAPFQNAEVIPIIDYSKLTNVFLISQM